MIENNQVTNNISTQNNDRNLWIKILCKIASPVLINGAKGTLKKNMPVDCIYEEKIKFAYLEAVGRLICGIGPWLESNPDNNFEKKLKEKYRNLAIETLVNICNPNSDDYLVFGGFHQPLVDVAFLTQGILRAKTSIWDKINLTNKELILNAFKQTESIEPYNTNWLLFASMIESFFLEVTGKCNKRRLLYGVNRFMNNWYCGDGHYSDGNFYHFDYYNSFVIHPMLTEILLILNKHGLCDENFLNIQLTRLKQYSSQLERLISPEGTYPIIGRSMTYRTGVFHALGQSCLLGLYDDKIKPEQVRSALTHVIKRQFCENNNFNADGWLTLGFNGNQKNLSEQYINTGSLYLCSTIFLPLGLSNKDRFWSGPYEDWTSLKGWSGKEIELAKPIDNYDMNMEHKTNLKLIELAMDYITARIDVKNKGDENNSLLIHFISDNKAFIDYPKWFCDKNGEGLIIQSKQGFLKLAIECLGDGELNVYFRGKDVKDKNGKRFPMYIDYQDITINGNCILNTNKLVCLEKPFIFKKSVKNHEIVNVSLKWLPFNSLSTYVP